AGGSMSVSPKSPGRPVPVPRNSPAVLPGMKPPAGLRPPPVSRIPPEIRALATDPPWMLLMKACGYDENGNPPPSTFADASGGAPRASPGVRSDAGGKPLLYETWWGFCPVVGSANQLFWGRTPFQKVCGGIFLALDL